MSNRSPLQFPSVSAWDALPPRGDDTGWLAIVSNSVLGLDYGTVQIVVHDGSVVQVERTERVRFNVRQGG